MRAIIFDMDGVLVDSTKYIWESFNMLLSKFGVQIPDKDIKKYLGRSLRDQIKMWREDYNLKEEIDFAQFSKDAFEQEIKLIRKNLKDNSELSSLLNSLKKNGFKLAVATSSHKLRAYKLLEILGIKNKFEVIITAEDVENHKPSPDVFLKAANKLNVDPKDCVVIEDAVNGIEAAKKGGMKAIALITKFHKREDFSDADLIIKSLSELNITKINNI
ncbi:MAG: HAD family phosphatase [Nanoarchaeota archaeon]